MNEQTPNEVFWERIEARFPKPVFLFTLVKGPLFLVGHTFHPLLQLGVVR